MLKDWTENTEIDIRGRHHPEVLVAAAVDPEMERSPRRTFDVCRALAERLNPRVG
jgi:hypothetical protein